MDIESDGVEKKQFVEVRKPEEIDLVENERSPFKRKTQKDMSMTPEEFEKIIEQ